MPQINVISGANSYPNLSFDGNVTVGDVREEAGTMCSIDDGSEAVVGGNAREDDYSLHDGDTVTFRKATGTKG